MSSDKSAPRGEIHQSSQQKRKWDNPTNTTKQPIQVQSDPKDYREWAKRLTRPIWNLAPRPRTRSPWTAVWSNRLKLDQIVKTPTAAAIEKCVFLVAAMVKVYAGCIGFWTWYVDCSIERLIQYGIIWTAWGLNVQRLHDKSNVYHEWNKQVLLEWIFKISYFTLLIWI